MSELEVDRFGTKKWRLNGLYHREDGPAIEWADGIKYWYLKDKLHRIDGPAVEWANGHKDWYVNGAPVTEHEYHRQMNGRSK